MNNTLSAAILCAVISIFLFGISAQAATITVTRTDDRNQISTCRNTGDCSLREAIGRSASGDLIVFSGTFSTPRTITLTSGFITKRLDVTQSIIIQGPGANLLTVSGNNSDRVFEIFGNTTVSVAGMTITGGNPQTVNFGSGGGGFIVKGGATLNLSGSTVAGNSAYDGGGIYVENSATLNLTGVTVSGNNASDIGGAIYNDFGTVSATNVTVSTNGASVGIGGIYNTFGTVNLTNATVTLNNSIGVQNGGGSFNVRNSIITNNGSTDAFGSFNSLGYNLVQNIGGGTFGFGATGDILGQSAQLGVLQNNGGAMPTHYPACTSPAVEGGDPLNPPAIDERGTARPIGFRADIGAVETACVVAVRDNGDSTPNSLRTAVNAVDPTGRVIFDPAYFNVPRTITLSREIVVSKSMTITGIGFLTVNGSDFDRIFNIQGGTIYLNSLNLTNGKSSQGGAIYNAATAHLNGVTVYANKGFQGGGIYNASTMTVTNSTVSGNLPNGANSNGGGIYNAGTLTLVNSTVSNNSTATGGGIYRNAGTVSVANTIIGGNSATAASPDVFGVFASQGANLVGNVSGATGFGATGDVLGQSPQLSALADNGGLTLTHVPTVASPALNAANPSLAVNPATSQNLTTDQRGFSRSVVGVDIGATELSQSIVTSNNDSGSGSLRLAVAETPSGNTIEFSTNFFSQSRTINLTGGQIVIDKNLTVNAPTNLTIDANLTNRIFYVNQGVTFNLNGGTLTRGLAPPGGSGGAIVNYGTIELYNSTISYSSAPTGDGGGGIANFGILDVTSSTINNNSAQNGGGIANNTSGSGRVNLVNTTISGNAATNGEGGGIVNFFGGIFLYASTIAFNTATTAGGGIINRGFAGNFIRPQSTIIANNTAGVIGNEIANAIESQGYNIVRALNGNEGGGFGATDIVGTTANPINVGLRPLANNGGATQTHSLQPTSPAINAASPDNYPFADQRGVSRPRGGRNDIGAFESATFVTNAATNGAESLRDALNNASDGDVITFDSAFFNTPQTINLGGGEIGITKSLTIQGPGAGKLTISGGNLSRAFSIVSGLAGVTINDLTITQGGNVPNGGAIFNSSPLTLNGVVLTGNAAGSTGGAIYNNYSTVNLNDCTVSNNISFGSGGGIYSQNFGSQTPGTSTLNIRSSTFSGNEARAGFGGGLLNNLGATRISNSTFSANSSTSGGSAIYQGASLPVKIVNSTFTLNNDTVSGVAVIAAGNSANDVINNSIVAGNVSGDIFGMNGANNLIGNGDGTNFVNGVSGNIVGTTANPVNPMLVALGNNGGATKTHGLQFTSLARNAGDNTLAVDPETNQPLTTDQRGFVRIVQGFAAVGVVDIGAFEAQTPTAASVNLGGRVTNKGNSGTPNAVVTLTGSNGIVRSARTNPFGYYNFADIPVGETYVVSVSHKLFMFEPRVVSVTEELTDLNFVGSIR